MAEESPLSSPKPNIWFVAAQIGATSEPWLWRQIVGFQRVRPTVVTSDWVNESGYPRGSVPLIRSDAVLVNDSGPSRWMRRAARIRDRNFYALSSSEQQGFTEVSAEDPPRALLCHFGQMSVRFFPLAERLGVPLVAHFHGLDLSSSLGNRWYRWSLGSTINRFAAHVVVGTHQAALLESWGVPRSSIRIIPCGVPVAEFPATVRSPDRDALRLVAVTRLVQQKGVDIALRAFAIARQAGFNVEFAIVGEGPERPRLERLAGELGVEQHVDFRGPLGQSEVMEALAQSDIFIQPSIQRGNSVEGFGVSVTEAAATELPVIVSDCGGLTDQVVHDRTGLIVPEGDVGATGRALVDLLSDEEKRVRFGKAGRQRAIKCFDTLGQVELLEDVLLSVTERVAR